VRGHTARQEHTFFFFDSAAPALGAAAAAPAAPPPTHVAPRGAICGTGAVAFTGMFCVCGRGRRGEDGTLLRVCGHNFLFVKRASLFQPFCTHNNQLFIYFVVCFGLKALRNPLYTVVLPSSLHLPPCARQNVELRKFTKHVQEQPSPAKLGGVRRVVSTRRSLNLFVSFWIISNNF